MIIIIIFHDLLLNVIIFLLVLPLIKYVLIPTESVVVSMIGFLLLFLVKCSTHSGSLPGLCGTSSVGSCFELFKHLY